jgi:hypothetical protein
MLPLLLPPQLLKLLLKVVCRPYRVDRSFLKLQMFRCKRYPLRFDSSYQKCDSKKKEEKETKEEKN